jgi:hypothetical protein
MRELSVKILASWHLPFLNWPMMQAILVESIIITVPSNYSTTILYVSLPFIKNTNFYFRNFPFYFYSYISIEWY